MSTEKHVHTSQLTNAVSQKIY